MQVRALAMFDLDSARWSWRALPIAALLMTFLVLTALSAKNMSLTYDEDAHYIEGQRILEGNARRFNPSAMPITALNALPQALSAKLPPSLIKSLLGRFPTTARMMTVLVSLGLGFTCFRWAQQINGYVPALLTLGLYAFEPNIIAHSQLVTTDLYAAAAAALTLYVLWRYAVAGGWGRGVLFGLTLGLAQVTKFTNVLLYPICLTAHALTMLPAWLESARQRRFRHLAGQVARFSGRWIGFAILSLLVINAGFLFERTLMPITNYTFRSSTFQSLQTTISSIANIPLPLPEPYLTGLDMVLYAERTAMGGLSMFYLFGRLNNTGFLGYYLIASVFKEPLAIQAIVLLSVVEYARRGRTGRFLKKDVFVIVPLAFFVVYFNLFNRFPKGIRHYLVVLPFTLVFCSSLLTGWRQWPRRNWYALLAACGFLIVSVLSYFPHYLSYFNELVPDRKFAYKVLADSNLDWGQNEWYLKQYLKQHPEAHVSPMGPVEGTIVVGVNEFLGVLGSPNTYAWLRCCYEPVDTVAYSYLVFDVPHGGLERLRSP